MKWDFESGAKGWTTQAPGCGIVPEPGAPQNHAYQIVATNPHHTRLVLEGSEKTPDFLISLRIKALEWEGAPPNIYVYGRSGKGGFRALTIGPDEGRVVGYYGQETPAASIGSLRIGFSSKPQWIHAAFACFRNYCFAKIWPAGSPEPRWQVEGMAPGLDAGEVALGVWTSPRTPSRAKVLFDDVEFQPVTEEMVKAWGIRLGPRPRLDLAQAPKTPGVFELPDRIGLASKLSAIAFDRETGEITNLVDIPTGQEFIASEVNEPLFRCALSKPYEKNTTAFTSRDFQNVSAMKTEQNALVLEFGDAPQLPVRVTVTAALTDEETIRLRIAIKNPSDWCVARVGFPGMPAPACLGESPDDDYLLIPWQGGGLVKSPGTRGAGSKDARYPGIAFAQFYTIYDDTAGLYVGMHDPDGHCKEFQVQCIAGRSVTMTLAHLFPEAPAKDAELPYDIVLKTFKGDWRDAADIYKAWAVRQPWCAKKLSERKDFPEFLKDGAGIIITGIANPIGRAKLLGEQLEKLPDLMDAYRKATGLKHMVFVPYGWENRGTWAGINYFPAVPSDDLWRKANEELKKRGHRTAFLTSGFWWVVKRQQTSNGPALDDTADFEQRKEMCIQNADGSIWKTDCYDRTKEFGSWRGLSVRLCHGSAQARETMKEIFLKAASLGVPLISFDQEIGGGQNAPCYSKSHGHPPGWGNWMWTGFRDVCAEILNEGKPIQPELGLFLENESELAIPYMATYWSRQFGELNMGMGGAKGVGLFSYLYHEYVTAIGAACVQGQGPQGTRPDALLRCRILANNLTRGLIPGPFMHDVPLEGIGVWEKVSAWHATVSRAYCSFCRPYAHFPEYLILGKTVRPLPVECETVEIPMGRQEKDKTKSAPKGGPALHLPAVTTGSFEAADSSVAAFIVNSTPDPREAVVLLPEGKQAIIYTADRVEEKRVADPRVSLSLEPFGVRVLVIN